MKKLILLLVMLFTSPVLANNSANTQLQFNIPSFLSITPLTNPVLIANIQNKNGSLPEPLVAKFRVVSNIGEGRTLYLRSEVITEDGVENSMFSLGGQVYVAFTNVARRPSHSALQNCKIGMDRKSSPRVVAYPVIQVSGGDKIKYSNGRYEIDIKNGSYIIDLIIGTQVLSSSYASNCPNGFYQAKIILTEADI